MVSIERIDPQAEADLRAWWETGAAATAERPGTPWPAWAHSRVALPAANPEVDLVFLLARDGGRPVGSALVQLRTRDNTHTASLDVWVPPAWRCRGTGSALVAAAERVAAAAGRTTWLSELFVAPGSDEDGGFATRRGYAVASRESIKELSTADYLVRREELRERTAAASAYEMVTFDTRCPERHLASFGRLLGMLMAEIPLGELDLADSEWTPERLRAAEDRQVATGRHVLTALALAPDGSVAGASDVRVNESEPDHGQIGITLVDPAHRGHALGLALKLATHDLALAAYPGVRTVETSNAEVNDHMNRVNELLGYRTVETLLELQKVAPGA